MLLFGLGSMLRLDTTGAPATGTSPVLATEPLPPTELPPVVEPTLVMVPAFLDAAV
jgi:hypothetical protein